ncbi:hypothetical protein TVAG_124400 [Trichomonas vaginalis G3]|uniref:Uncharacterized protein n=1 Tax=Trichomonas vaginalis (strain ATCC PRA-98 / G3) TaxID=412133 RepID=A2FYR4_TRIV3|nr:HID1 family [Trichomonas vaginalis G3]EAX89960.1 hypothetical protein TVAG_124400 [Trichomonas vaginalis G3]KAI5523683.1 HID1 family [Trichomonas vaginalis G3]|eukprot:XP_001302890.1 hypothetical protein [Trichomonas vaginalis G3]
MGGALSSSDAIPAFLRTLLSGACPPAHPIWASFNITSFNTSEMTKEDILLLQEVRDKRPDNFAELVRCITDAFTREIKLAENEIQNDSMYLDFSMYSDMICLLLSISGLPQKISPWFKAPTLYLKQSLPLHQVLLAEFRLLNMTDSIFNCYSDELQANITFVKTLLFVQQAEAFTYPVKSDPSQYLLSFDIFPAKAFLPVLFEFIPKAILTTRSEPILKYVRALITASILPIYCCNTWKTALSCVEQNIIHRAFEPLLTLTDNIYPTGLPGRVLACSDQLISLLYTVILRFPTFLKFIDTNKLAQKYIEVLLLLFRYKMDNGSITFIHSIILLIISHLTSDFHSLLTLNDPFVETLQIKEQRPHRGTYADLIIEIITFPLIKDFKSAFPLAPLVTAIIQNLSSTTAHLSFFNANRIYEILRLFFKSKAAEHPESKLPIARLLNSIYQFIRFQTLGKKSILLYGIVHRVIIDSLAASALPEWRKPAEKIKKLLDAADEPLKSKEKNADAVLQNAMAPILIEFADSPVPQTSFTMGAEVETIWYDWSRILLWRVFPDEAEFYHLNFLTFKSPGNEKAIPNPVPEESLSTEPAPTESFATGIINQAEQQKKNEIEEKEESEPEVQQYKAIEQTPVQQSSAQSIIEATKPAISKIRNPKLQIKEVSEPDQLQAPVKHAKTLEELDNPFGSDDEDELAKFLED